MSLLEASCLRGLYDTLDEVGEELRDVVVEEGSGREVDRLEVRCGRAAVELSWKLVVLLSQSWSICDCIGLSRKIGCQCFFKASAIAVGVVASWSSSVRIAPMLFVAPGIRRANLVMSCCFLCCRDAWSWWSSVRCA